MKNPFPYGDLKYYYQLHVLRMKARGWNHVQYCTFTSRLKRMSLHDAIYTPRTESQVRIWKSKTPIQDNLRRNKALKENNIPTIEIPNIQNGDKPTILDRFISLFR